MTPPLKLKRVAEPEHPELPEIPPEIQNAIVDGTIQPVEIIDFALENYTLLQFVPDFRLTASHMSVKIAKAGSEFKLVFEGGEVFRWKFWPTRAMRDITNDTRFADYLDIEEPSTNDPRIQWNEKKIGNLVLPFCYTNTTTNTIHTVLGPLADPIKHLIDVIILKAFGVIPMKSFSADIDLLPNPIEFLSFPSFQKSDSLKLTVGNAVNDEITTILESLFRHRPERIKFELTMLNPGDFRFPNNFILSVRDITLNCCPYLTRNQLITFLDGVARIVLRPEGAFNYQSYGDFLYAWYVTRETDCELHYLEVHDETLDVTKKKLFWDIVPRITPRDRQRGKWYRHKDKIINFNVPSVYDYKRADGLEASLLFFPNRSGFIFVVWHDLEHSIRLPGHKFYLEKSFGVDDPIDTDFWIHPEYHRSCTFRNEDVMLNYEESLKNMIRDQ